MSPVKEVQKIAKHTPASRKKAEVFSREELAAMKEYVKEKKEFGRKGSGVDKVEEEKAVLAKIAEMPERDRSMALRLHEIVKDNAPALSPKLWYGMPAYAREGKVICFFQNAQKFKTRYSTLGFSDKARLDDGKMWPTSYALMELTPTEVARIIALVKKAAS